MLIILIRLGIHINMSITEISDLIHSILSKENRKTAYTIKRPLSNNQPPDILKRATLA